jgi:putative transposase
MKHVVNRAYRYRIYPNKKQASLINQTIGCVRAFWNTLVFIFLSNLGKSPEERTACPTVKEWRDEVGREYRKDVSHAAVNQKEMDFNAYKDQKFSKNRKKKLGQPKFKKKHGSRQSYRLSNTAFQLEGNKIRLAKIGWVKIVIDREIPEGVKFINVTIIRETDGKYYASICVEETIEKLEPTGRTIGLDVGLRSFVTTSEGTVFDGLKNLRESQTKIKRLQRLLSRKKGSKKGEKKSRRWWKLRIRINRLYRKIVHQRQHFLHHLSTHFVRNYDTIVVEDLNVAGMMQNHHLAGAIGNVAWGAFFQMLQYKCNWYGRTFKQIDRFAPTSKTCSVCGHKKEDLKLSDRTYICELCGNAMDRDVNAAINIRALGVNNA